SACPLGRSRVSGSPAISARSASWNTPRTWSTTTGSTSRRSQPRGPPWAAEPRLPSDAQKGRGRHRERGGRRREQGASMTRTMRGSGARSRWDSAITQRGLPRYDPLHARQQHDARCERRQREAEPLDQAGTVLEGDARGAVRRLDLEHARDVAPDRKRPAVARSRPEGRVRESNGPPPGRAV